MLASGSPRRLALLAQIGVDPDASCPPRSTRRRDAAKRRARSPSGSPRKRPRPRPRSPPSAPTSPPSSRSPPTRWSAVGRRILPKCEIRDEADACLRLLSGRAHRVYTGLALVDARAAPCDAGWSKRACASSGCRASEIDAYLASGEWRGKAGGYAIQGLAGAFVVRLVGSYSSVVGLPLAETAALLPARATIRTGYGPATAEMSANDKPATKPSPTAKARRLPDLREAAVRALRPVLLEAMRRRRPASLAEGRLRHPGVRGGQRRA